MPWDVSTLSWGIPLKELKTFYPSVYEGTDDNVRKYLGFDFCNLYSFPNDCGSTILTGLEYVKEPQLVSVIEYCSRSGFNLIFGTLCTDNPHMFERQRALFRKFGFKASFVGRSNRNPQKNHVVLVKKIHNPKKVGY